MAKCRKLGDSTRRIEDVSGKDRDAEQERGGNKKQTGHRSGQRAVALHRGVLSGIAISQQSTFGSVAISILLTFR
jgi:hypothetical protein